MQKTTNNSNVKKLNRNRVFRYINSQNEACMTEIASALHISTPTVLSIVSELKEEGLIKEVGEYQSTGGRKAKALAVVRDKKYAIGLDITKNHIGLTYTDLSQKSLAYERLKKKFYNKEKYFIEVAEQVKQFVYRNQIPEEKIIGLGISAPIIVDLNTNTISNSHELGLFNISCKEWEKYMPYPSNVLNDANSAVLSEWFGEKVSDSMVYLSLNNTVGGATVYQSEGGNIYSRQGYLENTSNMFLGNNWRSGEFGHVVIHPNGKKCYCGKKGCVDAYCSALRLANMENGALEKFFIHLEEGSEKHHKVWEKYLDDLAIIVDNLRMTFDMGVVIGGYVGCYMEPYIPALRERLAKLDIFDNNGDYVRACSCKRGASALGAADYQMEKYIDSI